MKYDIIHLNGFMYAVDKDKKTWGKIAYNKDKNIIGYVNSHPKYEEEGFEIVATNDPALEDLPLLPAVEENVPLEGFNEVWSEVVNHADTTLFTRIGMQEFTNSIKKSWKAGYKAGKAKQFTEEDMEKAFLAGERWEDKNQAISRGEIPTFPEATFIEDFLESLKPKPIAVELEMEDWRGDGEDPDIGNHAKHLVVPKVDSTNHVIVKQWIWN